MYTCFLKMVLSFTNDIIGILTHLLKKMVDVPTEYDALTLEINYAGLNILQISTQFEKYLLSSWFLPKSRPLNFVIPLSVRLRTMSLVSFPKN